MTSGASLAIRKLSKSFGAPMRSGGQQQRVAIVEFALGGARGKNFVNPAPRLDESIA
jgi:ABC-type arginine transport system ATPase subunit